MTLKDLVSTSLAKGPQALLKTPMDFWNAVRELPLVETMQALTDLPRALETQMRETNKLIKSSATTLKELASMSTSLLTNLESMSKAAERLAEATPAMVAMADQAKKQMTMTTDVLAETNRQLGEVLRLAEPLDRASRRMERFFGRRKPSEESDEMLIEEEILVADANDLEAAASSTPRD